MDIWILGEGVKRLAAALILTLLFSVVGGGGPANSEVPAENPWTLDLLYLEKMLPDLHPNLFFKLSREEFSKEMEDLRRKAEGLKDEEIELELSRILARIGDSHTCIEHFSFFETEKIFPVKLEWLKDGLYVTAVHRDHSRILGCRLTAVNDLPIDEVIERLNGLIPHENEGWAKVHHPRFLQSSVILEYLDIAPKGKAIYRLEAPGGFAFEEALEARERSSADFVRLSDRIREKPLYSMRKEPFWYQYLPDRKLLYFQYNQCREKPPASPGFYEVLDGLMAVLKEKRVEKLVIDMRNNTGGSTKPGEALIDRLTTDGAFQGRIFVILGKRTFSSAVINALALKVKAGALLFGEPTGGSPNHFGEVQRLSLPHSKLKVQYSTRYFYLSDKYDGALVPDFAIEQSFDQYLKGIDPVMEAIFKF